MVQGSSVCVSASVHVCVHLYPRNDCELHHRRRSPPKSVALCGWIFLILINLLQNYSQRCWYWQFSKRQYVSQECHKQRRSECVLCRSVRRSLHKQISAFVKLAIHLCSFHPLNHHLAREAEYTIGLDLKSALVSVVGLQGDPQQVILHEFKFLQVENKVWLSSFATHFEVLRGSRV